MNRYIKILLIVVLTVIGGLSVSAKEYGNHPERTPVRFVVTPGKKLNVRTAPSPKAQLLTQFKPGDILYIEDITPIENDGYTWYKIIDSWGKPYLKEGYVTYINRLQGEDNPLYDETLDLAKTKKLEESAETTRDVTQWVFWILAVLFAIGYIRKYFLVEGKEKLLGYEYNGMRKTFFFNSQPYISVIIVSLLVAAGVVSALAALLGVGGIVLAVLYIVKGLCYVIVWIGILLCVGCAIATICGAFVAIVGVGVGGLIWYYDDAIEAFADRCAQTGLDFFNELNLFSFIYGLVIDYWQWIVAVICAPVVLFLVLAVIWMLAAGALILFEKIMTARYNVKHPCPHCQHPSEPATYLTKSAYGYEALPNGIKLRPGMYGLFHITHPSTNERMPTMLLNGRDTLPRECNNCGHIINAEEGSEKHVAFVGAVNSGKTTLTYRMIAEIFDRVGDDRVNFTGLNKNSQDDRDLVNKISSIRQKGRIDISDLPEKTKTEVNNSIQLIVKRKHAPLPYRLFINDVAGEVYSTQAGGEKNADNSKRFFRNVNSIFLIIDPLTTMLHIDFSPSARYMEWLDKYEAGKNKNEGGKERTDQISLKNLTDAIDNQIMAHRSDKKKIHLNIVLPKIDLGYIPSNYDVRSQERLREYIMTEMGLQSLKVWIEEFASMTIFAVSATETKMKSNISDIVDKVIVKQLDMNI